MARKACTILFLGLYILGISSVSLAKRKASSTITSFFFCYEHRLEFSFLSKRKYGTDPVRIVHVVVVQVTTRVHVEPVSVVVVEVIRGKGPEGLKNLIRRFNDDIPN